MSRDHVCELKDVCAWRKAKRLCAMRCDGGVDVYGFLAGSACLSLNGS